MEKDLKRLSLHFVKLPIRFVMGSESILKDAAFTWPC